jgi:hypothetical protein
MRKWVRIPVVLLLIVVAIVVPKGETAIHKHRCQAAWDSLAGKSLMAQIRRYYCKITGTRLSLSADREKLRTSREALVDVGYLIRKRFVLQNGPARAEQAFYKEYPETAFVGVEFCWDNKLVIIAPPSEMTTISNIVRRIDEGAQETRAGEKVSK